MKAAALALAMPAALLLAQAGVARAGAEAAPCPADLGQATRCLAGTDSAGAHYWIAVPSPWNGVLVLHAHGGPELGAPSSERSAKDLARWAVWARNGYAWAGSSYRQGGVALRAAAEDTESLRQIFHAQIAVPKRTVLHGQSWGGGVAALGAEMFTSPDASGRRPHDAVLLSSGVLGGGTRSYEFRLDLRVVYQAVCANHPRAGEAQYPLWQGLPLGVRMSRADLTARADECTGIAHPPAERSAGQRARLKTLLDVVRIPERTLLSNLEWATFHFQDIVFRRLGGRNPFGNEGVRYRGSDDDDALNRQVARYRSDPAAVAAFAADAEPSGQITLPVLTLHAVDDPTAFVELESVYRELVDRAGAGERLVQVFTDEHEHSYLNDAEYLAAMAALLQWAEHGEKPTPAGIAERCAKTAADATCRFLPRYQPPPLTSRVPLRAP